MEPTPPQANRPEPPSPRLIKACHRAGIAAAGIWWAYAFFATGFFSGIDIPGLLVYLFGVPVCYALAYFLVRGVVWLIYALR
jgi:hypothetical protein